MVSLAHTDEAVSLMRLLFVNYEFPPVGGGAAYASLATARELVAMGHRVDFLTAAMPDTQSDQELDGVHVLRVRCHRRPYIISLRGSDVLGYTPNLRR